MEKNESIPSVEQSLITVVAEGDADTTDVVEVKDYTDIYNRFIFFLSVPEDMREKEFGTKTETGFAEVNKIGTKTLWKWKQKDSFINDMHLATRRFLASNADKFTGAMVANPSDAKLNKLAIETAFQTGVAGVQILNINNLGSSSLDTEIDKLEQMIGEEEGEE